ncbi:MAG: ATP-binding protein [Parvularculaceae bacterium]
MHRLIGRLEHLLRIDAERPAESLMRIRAVYAIGAAFVATQILNMIVMAFSYGRWTYDHTITLFAVSVVVAMIACIRFYKNVSFYAVGYASLSLVGVLCSALPENTGINSALVPFIALGPVLAGFMAGKRAALSFFAAGVAALGFLYWVSISSAPTTIYGDYTRETNRFAQGFFALSLSTVISIFIAERIYMLLSELRETADRAIRAEAAKTRFLATMSHELRTPLNGVIGLTEALRRGALPDAERRLAETIGRSNEALLRILNDLLDMSKIEAGKLAIEPHRVCPQRVIAEAADAWRPCLRAKGLSLTLSAGGDAPDRVMMDDLRVAQILQNLLSNAHKFTDAGEVRLSLDATRLDDGRWRLDYRVADSGRGIDDGMIESIFDRFDQGAAGTARRYGGTGLGLPICRELAILMGGSVGVEKTGADGTTFLFTVTVDAVDDAAGETDDFDGGETYSHLRVLVADDNEVNRMVMGELLKGFGVTADFACDGPSCVNAAAAGFDLIFVDKEMPELDGFETARAIRSGVGASRMATIIAVTADGADRDLPAMLSAGIEDRILKPVSGQALADALRRAQAARAAA